MTDELTYTGPGCHCCGNPDTTGWWTLSTAPPDSLVFPPDEYRLCPRHLKLLQDAGATGRVHAVTGIRWWLVR
jgi:hypothetical protein